MEISATDAFPKLGTFNSESQIALEPQLGYANMVAKGNPNEGAPSGQN